MNRMSERGLLALLLLVTTAYALAEELTLVTYYPSPRGVYNELRVGGGNVSTPAGKLNVVQEDTSFTAAPAFRVDDRTPPDDTPFVIDRDGNVGIGTANPGAKLDITSTGPEANIVLNDTAGGGTMYQIATSGTGGQASAGSFWISRIGSAIRLLIDPNGNVGIGTTAPDSALDVNGTGRFKTAGDVWSNNGLVLFNTGGDGNEYLHISRTTSPDAAQLQAGDSTTWRAILLNPIDGNVGIGTTNPVAKLHVAGNTQIDGTIRGATYGFGGMFTYRQSDNFCDQPNPFTGGCDCNLPGGGYGAGYIGGLTTCLGGVCQTMYCYR